MDALFLHKQNENEISGTYNASFLYLWSICANGEMIELYSRPGARSLGPEAGDVLIPGRHG